MHAPRPSRSLSTAFPTSTAVPQPFCIHGYWHPEESVSRLAATKKRLASRKQNTDGKLRLRVFLDGASGLVTGDHNEVCDPYVTIKFGDRTKTSVVERRTRTPQWAQSFVFDICADEALPTLKFVVKEKNSFSTSVIGYAEFSTRHLSLNEPQNVQLALHEESAATAKKENVRGLLSFKVTKIVDLSGQVPAAEKLGNLLLVDGPWEVSIKLVSAENLLAMDRNGESDPFVKLRLGSSTCKSRTRYKTRSPVWNQVFYMQAKAGDDKLVLRMFDWNLAGSSKPMGECYITTGDLPINRSVKKWVPLKHEGGEAGEVCLVLTVSSLNPSTSSTAKNQISRVSINANGVRSCGTLEVHIGSANALDARDYGGVSDPYVVLQLGNFKQRTKTVPKTTNPEFNEFFIFPVVDIFDVLRVRVFDEDKGTDDFLGAVDIPLLEMNNNKKERFYLKKKSLLKLGKGSVLLKCKLDFHKLPAYLGLIAPRDLNLMTEEARLKPSILKSNFVRVLALISQVRSLVETIDGLFKWRYGAVSSTAFTLAWFFGSLYLHVYHIPFVFALGLGVNYLVFEGTYANSEEFEERESSDTEKHTMRERVQAVKQIVLSVQNMLGEVASFFERFQNFLDWKVPELCWLLIGLMLAASLIFFVVPVRYAIFGWGTMRSCKAFYIKYLRKGPPPEPTPPLPVNFLSRVPDNVELLQQQRTFPSKRSLLR